MKVRYSTVAGSESTAYLDYDPPAEWLILSPVVYTARDKHTDAAIFVTWDGERWAETAPAWLAKSSRPGE